VDLNATLRLHAVTLFGALAVFSSVGWAKGATPYLPLNLAPEIERDIERVLILADKPVMSRPIAAAIVLDALPAACRSDEVLCGRVRRFVERYMRSFVLEHASVAGAASDGATTLPNQHGMSSDSAWEAAAAAHWQPNDHIILTLGGVAYEDEASATGSMVSFGGEYLQLDFGFRDHWLSPFTDSAMIIGTQAQTLPSVTLSNYTPLTRFGISYQVFLAEMEHSSQIRLGTGFTSGNPRLAGLQLALEPGAGWSLSVNRIMQFGGGARGGTSFKDFLNALFRPKQFDNIEDGASTDEQFGNQVAALASRFIFPGRTPFAVYLEYAGEDSSYEGNYRFGNAALSVGITFPHLWRRFDLTYEASEWQNYPWYGHFIYVDGLRNEGHVLGHWGADARQFYDDVGAQTHMLRLGWEPSFGGYLQLQARTIANQDYSAVDYRRGYDLTLGYSRSIGDFIAGAEVVVGRDVFNEDFSRLEGFVRFGGGWAGVGGDGGSAQTERRTGANLFVDAGLNASRVTIRRGDNSPKTTTDTQVEPHFAIGARRAVSERSDLGVRVEVDRIEDELLLSVRALDYRYRFDSPLALSMFAGAARYSLGTPAYGYYFGAGVQWRDLLPRLDLSVDVRYADKVARDKLLPGDPPATPRPDMFYDISGATLSLGYRF
jgi:hypothetical protein